MGAIITKQGVSRSIHLDSNLMARISASAVTFGSIDGTSASISSPPIAALDVKPPGRRKILRNSSTGHVDGKASISSRSSLLIPGASSSATSTSTPSSVGSAMAPYQILPRRIYT